MARKISYDLVGVDLADLASQVQAFLEQQPVSYPIWTDPGGRGKSRLTTLFEKTGDFAVPTTIFVGRRGIIKAMYVGKLTATTPAVTYRKSRVHNS